MKQEQLLDYITRFESGEPEPLTQEEFIEFFQYLVDSGDAWSLQGFYGRTAEELIKRGLLKNNNKNKFTARVFATVLNIILLLFILITPYYSAAQSKFSIGTGIPVPIGFVLDMDYEYNNICASAIVNYNNAVYLPIGFKFAINEEKTFYGMLGLYITPFPHLDPSYGITFGSRSILSNRLLFKWTFGIGAKNRLYDGWGVISLLYMVK